MCSLGNEVAGGIEAIGGKSVAELSSPVKESRGKTRFVKRALSLSVLGFGSTLLASAACGNAGVCPPEAGGSQRALPPSDKFGVIYTSDPTADGFVKQVDGDLRRLWVARDQASWVNANFITDDTESLSAAGEVATSEYMTRAIKEAVRFDALASQLRPEVARQLHLLKIAQVVPAPSNEAERNELAAATTWMGSTYGKGKYCPKGNKCFTLAELSTTLSKSRNYDELLDAWKGWHSISPPMRERFARYVELGNKGAKEIGFADMGALWKSGYDMPPEAFEADIDRLWKEVKPLYDELHCYTRGKLQKAYGKDKVRDKAPIPAHLLGNMWAQDWVNVYDVLEPYKGQPSLDVSKNLKAKKVSPTDMVKLGEKFFTSLGLDPLPDSFWKRSLFTRPKDREVVCHASAWDVTWQNDLRIKMCIEPTEEDLITIHHELGHNYYFQRYYKLPMLFQQGANDGFHEGIGDTLALSVTPEYLKGLGYLDAVPKGDKGRINQLMKVALDKISFLPFGLLIDKWRWDVLSGKVDKQHYNEAWWKLRRDIQGIAPPVERTEADFDPGAKYHVPSSVPYIRYFLARIYQFQFHRALCKTAGHTGSLDTCSIYGNREAGKKLADMLSMGASKPWPEAMAAITGDKRADATAMVEYFAPLMTWLKAQNKGQACGW